MGNNDITSEGNSLVVKIKQEKIDAEIETKLQATLTVEIKREASDNGQNGGSESDSGTSISTDIDDGTGTPAKQDEEKEEKKSIEPVKSSNEILAELFKVFNAAPPEELLDDKRLLKKEHKHKKHKKEKKKKHERVKIEPDSDADSSNKSKHKKKKKHKHRKSEKEKDKDKDRHREREKSEAKSTDRKSKELGCSKEQYEKQKSKESEHKENRNDDRSKTDALSVVRVKKESFDHKDVRIDSRKRQLNGESSTTGGPNTEQIAVKRRCQTSKIKIELHTKSLPQARSKEYEREDGQISEISLSDEETYLKERERISDNERRHSREESSRNRRERSSTYGRSDGWRRRGTTAKANNRQRSSRSQTRSRSRSRSLGIDKKRLLEIARKNAISMFKRGSLPGCANMTEEVKDKVLLKMRYGGRTVQDLTEFCKKISNGENLSDLSSDEDSDIDKCGNAKAFHHPFQLKEREPIVMHIRNSTSTSSSLQPRPAIEEQTKVITMQFPVSSGQQHRMTEAWVPVETKDQLTPLPALPAAKQATNMFKTSTQKNIFGGTVPQQQEQEPAFKPVCGVGTNSLQSVPPVITPTPIEQVPPPPVPPEIINIALPPPPLPPTTVTQPSPLRPMKFVPDTAVPSMAPPTPVRPVPTSQPPPAPVPPVDNVFSQMSSIGNLDVSAIISKRLNAMRRLQDNPLDPEALKMMHSSQRDMSSWASSKHLPGQFTGSTGVNILKAHELNSGPQLWARRDQLTATRPVTGGMGMQLLQKMGWKPGEGLGRERNGALMPLLFDVKLDKRGLVSKDDHIQRQINQQPSKKQRTTPVGSGPPHTNARPQTAAHAQQNMQDKHPVCLLNELTSKRKWTPPLYTLVNEVGPSHSKMFLFSVSMNGQTFMPPQASNSKKEAKLLAARYCLQQIGVLPPL